MTRQYELDSCAASFDAEEALLAVVLTDASAIEVVRPLLTADGFFTSEHRSIYDAALGRADYSVAINPTTLAEALGGSLDDIGGNRASTSSPQLRRRLTPPSI
jgi:replicative DNA helicase